MSHALTIDHSLAGVDCQALSREYCRRHARRHGGGRSHQNRTLIGWSSRVIAKSAETQAIPHTIPHAMLAVVLFLYTITATAEALVSLRIASSPVAAATRLRRHSLLCSISDLSDDCDVAQVSEAVALIGKPSGSVEQQQAEVIAYLVRRLQLEDDVAEREKEWLYTIQVAGDLGRAGELLEEKDSLQEKLDQYSVREAEVAAAVAVRNKLKAQVEEGTQAAAEAEAELSRLKTECGSLEADLAAKHTEQVPPQLQAALPHPHRQAGGERMGWG
eukprot:scaffold6627_cov108-Isochrysis_galbana.AAC.3